MVERLDTGLQVLTTWFRMPSTAVLTSKGLVAITLQSEFTRVDHDEPPFLRAHHTGSLCRRVQCVANNVLEHAGQLASMRRQVDDRGRWDFEVLGCQLSSMEATQIKLCAIKWCLLVVLLPRAG